MKVYIELDLALPAHRALLAKIHEATPAGPPAAPGGVPQQPTYPQTPAPQPAPAPTPPVQPPAPQLTQPMLPPMQAPAPAPAPAPQQPTVDIRQQLQQSFVAAFAKDPQTADRISQEIRTKFNQPDDTQWTDEQVMEAITTLQGAITF